MFNNQNGIGSGKAVLSHIKTLYGETVKRLIDVLLGFTSAFTALKFGSLQVSILY